MCEKINLLSCCNTYLSHDRVCVGVLFFGEDCLSSVIGVGSALGTGYFFLHLARWELGLTAQNCGPFDKIAECCESFMNGRENFRLEHGMAADFGAYLRNRIGRRQFVMSHLSCTIIARACAIRKE